MSAGKQKMVSNYEKSKEYDSDKGREVVVLRESLI